MKTIPPRVSSRNTKRCGVYKNLPASDTSSATKNIIQTPPSQVRSKKTPKGINRREGIEAQTHRTIRSPLSDRLHGRRRAFERLLTRSGEKLRGTQSSYHVYPPIYIKEPEDPFLQPAPSTETIRCGQANGFYEHTRWMAPHLKAVGQDGSIVIHHEKPRLPDLISIGSDGSHDDNNSRYSGEDKTPTKRRSVKVLAAMFEDPHESPLTTRKPKVGAPKDAFGLAEGAYQDKQALYQVNNSPHKLYHSTKILHGHPEAAGDVELKPMANNKRSPSSNAWPLVDT